MAVINEGIFNPGQRLDTMKKESLRILQLGKFYPIRGGVEKVMYDLMWGLSEQGVECDMMCASEEKGIRIIEINEHASQI